MYACWLKCDLLSTAGKASEDIDDMIHIYGSGEENERHDVEDRVSS